MGATRFSEKMKRRGARLLAALGTAALGLGAIVGVAPAAQAAGPGITMFGTVTFKPGFVPNTALEGPFGTAAYGMVLATDKANGPFALSGGSGPSGLSLFMPDYSTKTRKVSFAIFPMSEMLADKNYALVYLTPQETALLSSPPPGFDPSTLTPSYVTREGLLTRSFASAGTFKVGQSGININLDPKVTGKKPTISGTAKVGKRLKAKVNWQPSGVTYSYKWYRNGKAIKKATKSSYKVSKADRGKKISVKVTGKKSGYKTLSLKSSSKRVR